jgi:hypothetical protein
MEQMKIEQKPSRPAPPSPPAPAGAHVPVAIDTKEVIEFDTPEGQHVSLTLQFFIDCVCPQARSRPQFAAYMLGWCKHNRVDPLSSEAYFSVMKEAEKDRDGNKTGNWIEKPVIMVSRDCWLRRMERHPMLEWCDGGLLVELSTKRLQAAILGGMGDDYLVPQALKDKLLDMAINGKASAQIGEAEGRLTVRKRGQFLADGETLKGAWFQIKRKDRPVPILTELNSDGWKKDGIFWKNMEPWMMFKTVQKNGVRMAFPELSGLVTTRDIEDLDAASAADYEIKQEHDQLNMLRRRLFAIGRTVPAPVGPLGYEELHALSVENFDRRGLSELTPAEMSGLLDVINKAAHGDEDALAGIQEDLGRTNHETQTDDDTGIADAELRDAECTAAAHR